MRHSITCAGITAPRAAALRCSRQARLQTHVCFQAGDAITGQSGGGGRWPSVTSVVPEERLWAVRGFLDSSQTPLDLRVFAEVKQEAAK